MEKLFTGLLLGGLCLVACGGSRNESLEPTAINADEQISQSVQQTLAAIAVAQTVAAITENQPTAAAPTEAATQALPTPEVLPSSTTAPTAPPEATALPTQPPTAPPTTSPPPTAPPATSPPPTAPPPTAPPPTPTATVFVPPPPVIENDAPGGSFPQDGSVTFNIIVDPAFLFRMDVRVLDVGDFEGAGIDSVTFFISGNGVDYFREERTAGFCVFGGGEPTCNPWPRNALGQYTWGVDGPVVESGDYFVNMAVEADEPDEEFGGFWNWNFDFQVTIP